MVESLQLNAWLGQRWEHVEASFRRTFGFTDLKRALALLRSSEWPIALPEAFACHPMCEDAKRKRGKGIVDLFIDQDLNNVRFLDFGCGEGHAVCAAQEDGPSIALGYDICPSERWSTLEKREGNGAVFSTDFGRVATLGPYDVVLLFDVLDHVTKMSPQHVLGQAASLLAENGRMYLRCHPFTSRHALHVYPHLNKAFLHLVFTPKELSSLASPPLIPHPHIRGSRPLDAYEAAFSGAGLRVVNRQIMTQRVEPFFQQPLIAARIMRTLDVGVFPAFQMSLQFVDYVLERDDST